MWSTNPIAWVKEARACSAEAWWGRRWSWTAARAQSVSSGAGPSAVSATGTAWTKIKIQRFYNENSIILILQGVGGSIGINFLTFSSSSNLGKLQLYLNQSQQKRFNSWLNIHIKGGSKKADKVNFCFRDILARQHRNITINYPNNILVIMGNWDKSF